MKNKGDKFAVQVGDKEVSLYFRKPNQEELFEIDLRYRTTYSQALRAGVMPEAEAKKLLKKSGAWTKEDDDAIERVTVDIAKLQILLEKADGKPSMENMQIAEKMSILRAEQMEKIIAKTQMLANSAEGIANDQRIHKFIELCCVNTSDGDRFFGSYEAYSNFVQREAEAMSTIYKQAYLFDTGFDGDVMNELPEYVYMRKVSEANEKETEELAVTVPKEEEVQEKPKKRKK